MRKFRIGTHIFDFCHPQVKKHKTAFFLGRLRYMKIQARGLTRNQRISTFWAISSMFQTVPIFFRFFQQHVPPQALDKRLCLQNPPVMVTNVQKRPLTTLLEAQNERFH